MTLIDNSAYRRGLPNSKQYIVYSVNDEAIIVYTAPLNTISGGECYREDIVYDVNSNPTKIKWTIDAWGGTAWDV